MHHDTHTPAPSHAGRPSLSSTGAHAGARGYSGRRHASAMPGVNPRGVQVPVDALVAADEAVQAD